MRNDGESYCPPLKTFGSMLALTGIFEKSYADEKDSSEKYQQKNPEIHFSDSDPVSKVVLDRKNHMAGFMAGRSSGYTS
jgi:hypothetical protein